MGKGGSEDCRNPRAKKALSWGQGGNGTKPYQRK